MKKRYFTSLSSAGCWSAVDATEYVVLSGANSVVTGIDNVGISGQGLSAFKPFATITSKRL